MDGHCVMTVRHSTRCMETAIETRNSLVEILKLQTFLSPIEFLPYFKTFYSIVVYDKTQEVYIRNSAISLTANTLKI